MNARAASLSFLVIAARLAMAAAAHAQSAPPPAAYGVGAVPAPPIYYAPAAPPPPAPVPPPGYPVSPRDYGSGPSVLEFREGMFVPPGYHLSTRPHQQLLGAGASMLAAPYVIGLVASVFDGFDNQKGWLFLPVLGPWLTSSKRVSCSNASLVSCTANDSTATVLLATDGIVQAAGVATMLLAVAVQERVLRRNDTGAIVVPSAVGSGAGVSAVGAF